MRTLSIALLLPIAALAAAAATAGRAPLDPALDSILGLHMVPVAEDVGGDELAPIRKAFEAFAEGMEGVAAPEIFVDRANGQELVLLTRYDSLEAAEDAALAFDGSKAEAVRSKIGTGTPPRFFRELRCRDYGRGPAGYTEVVVFRTRPGTTRAQHLELFDAAEAGFAKEEGVAGHSLGLSPEGHWIHLVHWSSAEAFERSSRALMGDAGVRKWITSLDFKRFTQRHGAAGS